MIKLDGAEGEGGGQIIRTALGLSILTGEPLHLTNVRARRSRPGLQPQHKVAVLAAAEVSHATIGCVEVGSTTVHFAPGKITPGDYTFDIRTAGSTTLVLQTLLPALMCAAAPSRIVITGGTHNPFAPTAGFLANTFAPTLAKFGPQLQLTANPYGFYPAGGGKLTATIDPRQKLNEVQLLERGHVVRRQAIALCSQLPESIGQRELKVVQQRLGWTPTKDDLQVAVLANTRSPANVVELTLESEHATETTVAFGERGKPAEKVAEEAAADLQRYIAAEVPIGEHLADQILIPLALAGRGSFMSMRPTLHTTTNMRVIEQFLPVKFTATEELPGKWRIEVRSK